MRLYTIAHPNDLLQATERRLRQRLLEAGKQYFDLSAARIDQTFKDAVMSAVAAAPDRPPIRAWLHTISQLSHLHASRQLVPYSSLLGHLSADGPSVGRLFELLGWEALGAAFNRCGNASFELPAAPPCILPMGEFGAFSVGEQWPIDGRWSMSIIDGVARLTGPSFAASSLAPEPAWTSNIHLASAGIDATIPLANPSLMNRDFQEFPMVRSRRYATAWAPTVMRAVEAIQNYSPFAVACTRAFVTSIVPLVGGDDSIGSASREDALGLIFLPASNAFDEVTECLLHETMHQYLFRIEECGALFSVDTDTSERYYSPWRSDPRSLRMTLHGAFVFVAVADFYLWDDAPMVFEIDRRECLRRAYHRAKQVRIALDVVRRHARLTRFGSVVIDAVEQDAVSIFDRSAPSHDDCASVDAMLMAHSRQYASYSR